MTKGIPFLPIPSEALDRVYYRDGNLYWSYTFRGPVIKDKLAGSKNSQGYMTVGLKGKHYMVHRVIWAMHFGDSLGIIDHIDGDISNNKLENLRAVTYEQSSRNTTVKKTSSTGIKNVQQHSQNKNKYQVSFCIEGKKKYFGIFDSIEEAELFATKKRAELHGNYARQV